MYWDIMGGGYFETMQQEQLAAMEAFFGPHKKYYAIDGGGFPPKALVTGERKGSQYAFTLGNGALVQPKVEQTFRMRHGNTAAWNWEWLFPRDAARKA